VDPARGRFGEHGSAVLHHEGSIPLEGGIAVRHHADEPLPRWTGGTVNLERGEGIVFAPGTERARFGVVNVGRRLAWKEDATLALGSVCRDRHPTTRQRIETQLIHPRVVPFLVLERKPLATLIQGTPDEHLSRAA
jgi:hypothetical protein